MVYTMSRLEEYVKDIYKQMDIYQPDDICMTGIATALNVHLHYKDDPGKMVCVKGQYHIVINQSLSPAQQWEDFAHELGHVLKHVGNQRMLNEQFVGLQESQANNFMYHFCIPTFMLSEFETAATRDMTIHKLAKEFGVTVPFARRRFEMYERKLFEYELSEQIAAGYEVEYEKQIEKESEEINEVDPDIKPITMQEVAVDPDKFVLFDAYGKEFYITKEEYGVYKYIEDNELSYHLHLTPDNIELGFRSFLNSGQIEEYERLKEQHLIRKGK